MQEWVRVHHHRDGGDDVGSTNPCIPGKLIDARWAGINFFGGIRLPRRLPDRGYSRLDVCRSVGQICSSNLILPER